MGLSARHIYEAFFFSDRLTLKTYAEWITNKTSQCDSEKSTSFLSARLRFLIFISYFVRLLRFGESTCDKAKTGMKTATAVFCFCLFVLPFPFQKRWKTNDCRWLKASLHNSAYQLMRREQSLVDCLELKKAEKQIGWRHVCSLWLCLWTTSGNIETWRHASGVALPLANYGFSVATPGCLKLRQTSWQIMRLLSEPI